MALFDESLPTCPKARSLQHCLLHTGLHTQRLLLLSTAPLCYCYCSCWFWFWFAVWFAVQFSKCVSRCIPILLWHSRFILDCCNSHTRTSTT